MATKRKLNPEAQLNKKNRKAAPPVRVYARDRIAERDQIRMGYQDSLPAEKRESRSLCYMARENVPQREMEGWKPCGRVKDGKELSSGSNVDLITHKGDVLMWMPKDEYLERKASTEMGAVQMLDNAVAGDAPEDAIKDGHGDIHRLHVTSE